jgi:hypothetical protein
MCRAFCDQVDSFPNQTAVAGPCYEGGAFTPSKMATTCSVVGMTLCWQLSSRRKALGNRNCGVWRQGQSLPEAACPAVSTR